MRDDTRRLRRSTITVACFVGAIWLIWLTDFVLNLELRQFGVYPREPDGLIGILVAPLIHGSFKHVFSNTLPTLILGTAFLYAYPRSAKLGIPVIYVGSGLGVWLFARSSYHIGASGLNYGMMFFLFVVGILRRDRPSIAVSLIVFFLYGSMIWGIFPGQPGISFESHLFGAAMGIFLAIVLRKLDPLRPAKRYDWEDEPEDMEDPIIGKQWRQHENGDGDR
ncbi:MAG: rhomboid family intramembrane serine protease [Gammaproteobacteria bacterium]|nr:rhomboid family intramembrane serine protease [Gammaproteobacteria bacterium]